MIVDSHQHFWDLGRGDYAWLTPAGGGKLKGLRPMIQDIADPDWVTRPALDAAFEAIAARELVFDALVRPKHLGVSRQLIERLALGRERDIFAANASRLYGLHLH